MAEKPPLRTLVQDAPYLLGVAGYAVVDSLFATWLIYFFAPPSDRGVPLVDPLTFGAAFLTGKILEATVNPLAGYGADRSGKPWLFLLGGALVAVGAGLALFYLPAPGENWRNLALLFTLLPLSLMGQACFIVPYLGLLPQLAANDRQLVRLTSLQAVLIPVGVLVGQVLSSRALPPLNNDIPLMVTCFALLGLGAMLLPQLQVRGLQARSEGFSPTEAIAILLRNPGFRFHVLAQSFFWLGFSLVRLGALYFVTVLLGQQKDQLATYLGVIFLVMLPSLVAIRYLVPLLGKRKLMILATAVCACVTPLLYSVGRPLGELAPTTWAIVLFGLLGFPLAVFSAVQNPIVAEQVQRDATLTGVPKSALFFGVQGLIIKISTGLSGLLLGWLLKTFGSTGAQPLGVQLLGPVAALFVLGACAAYFFYPRDSLTRKQGVASAGGPETT